MDSAIKLPMIVRLYADEVLVAEIADSSLFSAALQRIILHQQAQLAAPLADQNKGKV